MSISIGLGLKNSNESMSNGLSKIAAEAGYSLQSGISSFEEDVRGGIQELSRFHSWSELISIRSPNDFPANTAFGIYEEMIEYHISQNEDPPFFDFFRSLDSCARVAGVEKIGIFFASEWNAGDKIRTSYGDVSTLLSLMKLPGAWNVLLLNLNHGGLQIWDEWPFFFELRCN